MPLEINEIGIRLEVRDRDDYAAKSRPDPGPDGCGGVHRDEIVEECVRRVLRRLEQAGER